MSARGGPPGAANMSMSRLLDSGSLVDLLSLKKKVGTGKKGKSSSSGSGGVGGGRSRMGGSTAGGVGPVASLMSARGGGGGIGKRTSQEALDLIATIIREETGIGGGGGGGAAPYIKKKGTKAATAAAARPPMKKKISFLVDDANTIMRARSQRKTQNNVFSFSAGLGLSGDDTAYIERQNQSVKLILDSISDKLDQGRDMLKKEDPSQFSNSDGNLLINFTALAFDKGDFQSICLRASIDEDASTKEEFLMDYDSWKSGVMSTFRRRFITHLMAERRGQVRSQFLKQQFELLSRHTTLSLLSSGELLIKTFASPVKAQGSFAADNSMVMSAPLGDRGDEEFKEGSVLFGDTMDADAFSSTVGADGLPIRASSQPSGDQMGQMEFFHDPQDQTVGSRMSIAEMMAGSRTSMVPSLDLPPVRNKRKQMKVAQKRKLIDEGGFDENLGRSTPRCLKLNVKAKPSIEALRRELTMAQESVSMLNNLVDDNLAWVHSNCNISTLPNAISERTKERCRRLSLEKLFSAFENLWDAYMLRILNKWKMATKFLQLQQMAVVYNRSKGLEMLCWTMGEALNRQYMKAWKPWFGGVRKQILLERDAGSCEIQKIIRGFLGRIKAFRVKLGKYAIRIQCMVRKRLARKKVAKRRRERQIKLMNAAARVMQEWFRGRVKVFKAKRRVMRRRYNRAANRIQKVFRGHRGRMRFATIKAKMAAMKPPPKPSTPEGKKGVLSNVKSWFGGSKPSPVKEEPVHSTTNNVTAPITKIELQSQKAATAKAAKEEPPKFSLTQQVNRAQAPVPKPAPEPVPAPVAPVKDVKETVVVKEEVVEQTRVPTPQSSRQPTPTKEIEYEPEPEEDLVDSRNRQPSTVFEGEDGEEDGNNSEVQTNDGSEDMGDDGNVNGIVKLQSMIRGRHARKKSSEMLEEKKSKGKVRTITESNKSGKAESKKAVPSINTSNAVEKQAAQKSGRPASSSRSDAKPSSSAPASKPSSARPTHSAANSSRPENVERPPSGGISKKDASPPQSIPNSSRTPAPASTMSSARSEQIQRAPTPSNAVVSQITSREDAATPYIEDSANYDYDNDNRQYQQDQQEYEDYNRAENDADVEPNVASYDENESLDVQDKDDFAEPSEPKTGRPGSSQEVNPPSRASSASPGRGLLGRTLSSFSFGNNNANESGSPPRTADASSAENVGSATPSRVNTADTQKRPLTGGLMKSLSSWGNWNTNSTETISENEATEGNTGVTNPDSPDRVGTSSGSRDNSPGKLAGMLDRAASIAGPLGRKLTEYGSSFSNVVTAAASKYLENSSLSRGSSPLRMSRPVSRKKFVRPDMSEEEAIARIQSAMRIKLAKARVQIKRNAVVAAQKRAVKLLLWAIITMQRIARGRIGRRRFKAQEFAVKKDRAAKQVRCAIKIQAAFRGMKGRRRFKMFAKKRDEERQMASWLKYQKAEKRKKKKGGADSSAGAAPEQSSPAKSVTQSKTGSTPQPASTSTTIPVQPANLPPGVGVIPDTWDEDEEDERMRALDEKLKRLEALERNIKEKEELMEANNRLSEQRAAAMEKALKEIEEKMKIEEAERLARQQLAELAGGISHRSDFYSSQGSVGRSTGRGGPMVASARGPMPSGRGRGPASARDAPPTARSARDGIPPDAPRLVHNGKEWRQLYDPEQKAMYWYCEKTMEAQWETPGEENYNYDSGYESSGGALTDYSTDYESGNENVFQTNGGTVWQVFWDEQAQSKYWYNAETGEATWTRPAGLPSDAGSGTGSNPASSRSGSAADWVSYIDESTGQEYWYNIHTGETSWA